MDVPEAPKKPINRPAPIPAVTIVFGLMPWLAAWSGSYVLHNAIASFLFYHGLCVSSAIAFRTIYGPRDGKVFHHRRWLLLAVACLVVCFITYAVAGLFGWLVQPVRVIQGLRSQHIPLNTNSIILLFLYFALVNPVVEEYFWRGTIYSALRRQHWTTSQSATVDALLFGSWHWLIVRLFFPPALALLITAGIVAVGALFCRFYETTKSLPAVCVLHGLGADVPILVLLWSAVLTKAQ